MPSAPLRYEKHQPLACGALSHCLGHAAPWGRSDGCQIAGCHDTEPSSRRGQGVQVGCTRGETMCITIDATDTQFVTALAALAAAAAAFAGPFVGYWAAKRGIRSQARIDWNLELRNSITAVLSAVWQASQAESMERLMEDLRRLTREKNNIALLLNPDESLHEELNAAIQALEDVSQELAKARHKDVETKAEIESRQDTALEKVLRFGRAVTKAEWVKV